MDRQPFSKSPPNFKTLRMFADRNEDTKKVATARPSHQGKKRKPYQSIFSPNQLDDLNKSLRGFTPER